MGVIEASDRAWKGVQMKSEKQGVSAWLRGLVDECGVSGTRSCLDIAEVFGIDCKHEKTCRDCIAKMMTAIADRIDAERALPEGVEWPRFEDGGLVRIGDELEFEGKTMLVCDATFYADGWALWCDREDMSGRLHGSYGERVKRPAPKVLDADGVPIKVGDVVYFVDGDARPLTVERIDANGGEPAVDLVYAGQILRWYSANPEKLTHERPDSWRLWGEDLDMAVKVGEVDKVGMMRRAKALAKAGEGL
ncbi:hypothetical protein [Ellagibacter isourolithinifaciens]|uniref:hypothetical protein n=1 Tax=Ellagibacter isourolithinifaciens TaxID=2137581 RepID=UPI003AEFE3CD